MRRLCGSLGLLSAILGFLGCKNESLVRPPKNAELFTNPPDEKRYDLPPEPPKECLNQDQTGKFKNGDPNAPNLPSGSKMKMGSPTGQ